MKLIVHFFIKVVRESKEMLKDYERSVDETIEKESYALKNRNCQIAELEKKANDMLMREIQVFIR